MFLLWLWLIVFWRHIGICRLSALMLAQSFHVLCLRGGYYVFTMSHCPKVCPIILCQHRISFTSRECWMHFDEPVIFWAKLYQRQRTRIRQKIRIDVKLVLIYGGITWPRTVFSFLVVCLCGLVCIVSCGKCQIGWLPPAGVWDGP